MVYGLPLMPAGFSFWIVNLSDRYFLQVFTTTSEVGLYQVGTAIAAVAVLGSKAFQQAFTPFFLSIYRDAGAKTVFADVFLAYAWGSCVLSAGLSLFAPEALRLLATHEYAGAASVVGILSLAAMGAGLRYVASVGLSAEKANWPITAATVGGAVASACLNLILVPTMGRTGAAISALLTHLLVCAYLFREGQKRYRVPYRYGPALACLALALAVMAAGTALPGLGFWTGILFKAALLASFIPALFLFKILSDDQGARLAKTIRVRFRL